MVKVTCVAPAAKACTATVTAGNGLRATASGRPGTPLTDRFTGKAGARLKAKLRHGAVRASVTVTATGPGGARTSATGRLTLTR